MTAAAQNISSTHRSKCHIPYTNIKEQERDDGNYSHNIKCVPKERKAVKAIAAKPGKCLIRGALLFDHSISTATKIDFQLV